MPGRAPARIVVTVAALAAAVALVWWLAARRPAAEEAPVAVAPVEAPRPAPPSAPSPAAATEPEAPTARGGEVPSGRRDITWEDVEGLTIAEQAALLGDTDLSDGLDLPLPTADAPRSELRERPPEDPGAVIRQREAGLELLDRTVQRLERDAERLEREGDADGARRARIRIERTIAIQAVRAEELARLRRGEALETSDPEEAAPPPGGPPP